MRSRIREFRKRQGMTQHALAEAVGCQRSALSEWETGTRRVPTAHLWQLARCLRVTVDELYDVDEPDAPANGHAEPLPPARAARVLALPCVRKRRGRRGSRAQH